MPTPTSSYTTRPRTTNMAPGGIFRQHKQVAIQKTRLAATHTKNKPFLSQALFVIAIILSHYARASKKASKQAYMV